MAQRVTLAIPDPSNPGQDVNLGTASNPIVTSSGGAGAASSQVQGNSASGASDIGNPVKIGGAVSSGGSSATNGQRVDAWFGVNGQLVVAANQFTATDAQTNAVVGFPSALSSTARLLMAAPYVFNGSTWDRVKKPNSTSRIVSSAATTNPTVAKAAAGDLFRVSGYNSNAAARYLKLYNKATAPTVGTDSPVWTEYLAPQAKFDLSIAAGMYFSAGISYALVTGSADSDATAVGVGDILGLNLAYA